MTDYLHPMEGNSDVLWRYGKVAPCLNNFLKWKEIASKIIGKDFVVLKRWTKLTPLFIQDMNEIDEDFLKLRSDKHLDEVKDKLTVKQILIWQYFVPRKLINFFYATNNEFGNKIDRIFIDIDRQNSSSNEAQKVACELNKVIKSDSWFPLKHKILNLWTWSSFHVYLMLEKNIDNKFYEKYLSYGPKKNESFIMKRAEQISKVTKLNVLADHERKKDALILDSSNTPPWKLARCPFSLHIKNAETIDGVCLPVSEKELEDLNLIKKLEKITLDEVWENIWKYKDMLN